MAHLHFTGIRQMRSALTLVREGHAIRTINHARPFCIDFASSLASFIRRSTNFNIKSAFPLQFGEREISIRKDFRRRYYQTNPIIECRAGVNAGHVEVLLLRHWLIIFSKAQKLHNTKSVIAQY